MSTLFFTSFFFCCLSNLRSPEEDESSLVYYCFPVFCLIGECIFLDLFHQDRLVMPCHKCLAFGQSWGCSISTRLPKPWQTGIICSKIQAKIDFPDKTGIICSKIQAKIDLLCRVTNARLSFHLRHGTTQHLEKKAALFFFFSFSSNTFMTLQWIFFDSC